MVVVVAADDKVFGSPCASLFYWEIDMTLVEAKANELYKLMNPATSVVNIIIIMALIQLLMELVKAGYVCWKKPKSILDAGRNPGIISKLVMKRMIKKHLKDRDYTSVDDVIRHIQMLSLTTTEEQITGIQAEIHLK